MTIQEQYDASSGTLALRPDEYRGPLVIQRPGTTIDGNGATIWAEEGPVIEVRARGVTLRNMRVEITSDYGGTDTPENAAILSVAPDTILDNVEVQGNVSGLSEKPGGRPVPRTFDLGAFASGEKNAFLMQISSPAPGTLRSEVSGVSVSPTQVHEGVNTVTLTTVELAKDTSVYGSLILETGVRRRIYIRGTAEPGAPKRSAPQPRAHAPAGQSRQGSTQTSAGPRQPVSASGSSSRGQRRTAGSSVPPAQLGDAQLSPSGPVRGGAAGTASAHGQPASQQSSGHLQQAAHTDAGSMQRHDTRSRPGHGQPDISGISHPAALQRGERKELPSGPKDRISIRFAPGAKSTADVDAYVFALGKDKRVRGDEDLFFFGHPGAPGQDAACILKNDGAPEAQLQLCRAEPGIDRFVIAFAEYEHRKAPQGVFRNGTFSVLVNGREVFTFSSPHTGTERTVVAAEVYRYKGGWRIRCVDEGLRDWVDSLCRTYGVDIG